MTMAGYYRFHYENMPIQIYWKFTNKNWKFSDENFWRGGSNEYPQSMFFEQK